MGEQQWDRQKEVEQRGTRLVHVGRVQDGAGHCDGVMPEEYREHCLDLGHIDAPVEAGDVDFLEGIPTRIGTPVGRLHLT